ncbi:MAG TPA: hypothetical protein V6D18_15080, partial [Thermosynechococcaceae cyanobacterium]
MVAGQSPSLGRSEIEAMWAGFERHVGGPIRKAGVPFGFTIGNHDASAALSVGGNFLFPVLSSRIKQTRPLEKAALVSYSTGLHSDSPFQPYSQLEPVPETQQNQALNLARSLIP